MKTRRTAVSRREFLAQAAVVAGGVSLGLVGLQAPVARAEQAPTKMAQTASAVLQQSSSITAALSERL